MREVVYAQEKGILWLREEANGEEVARLGKGYAGHPPYVNRPEAEAIRFGGPLPRGRYRIHRPFDHSRLGPLSLYLEPFGDSEMFGRSGFFIHGDNRFGNQTASHGCIVVSRSVRDKIAAALPATLVVV